MCLASMDFSTLNVDPAKDAPAVSQGLKDTAAFCRPDQAALAMRLSMAAAVIDGLLSLLQQAEHAARINAETIKEMQRAHAEEIRAMREEIRDAVAEARWSQHENGGW